MNLQQKLSKVYDNFAYIIRFSRETEKAGKLRSDRAYASQIVNRILKVIQDYSPEGCLESKFVPAFKLEEADFMDYALKMLCNYGIIRKEVKYFLREEKK